MHPARPAPARLNAFERCCIFRMFQQPRGPATAMGPACVPAPSGERKEQSENQSVGSTVTACRACSRTARPLAWHCLRGWTAGCKEGKPVLAGEAQSAPRLLESVIALLDPPLREMRVKYECPGERAPPTATAAGWPAVVCRGGEGEQAERGGGRATEGDRHSFN